VFNRATDERKPVLLSIVTAWSDACAAMDGTTYADPDVVSLIEARYVAVRVDADRRPDINDRYNLGGWPTTVFLTGAGDVLSGGTYLNAIDMAATLRRVADAFRDRGPELAARAATSRRSTTIRPQASSIPTEPHSTADFRALLLERFDRVNGGFGSAPKLPHAHALLFALSLAGHGDADMAPVAEITLDRMRGLWDRASGGFARYAEGEDWTLASAEKTLEDNAVLLHVYVEGALQLRDGGCREMAGELVRWARNVMFDPELGGFFNAQSDRTIDKTMYVDKNAMMVGALLRAAALFDDIWLRDAALNALEGVIVPAYKPGDGVAHVAVTDEGPPIRGLLTDQIHVASALIWAHAATGQLPYSMLAAEVLQFAARTMWDEASGRFRDRVNEDDPLLPFELNCHAAVAFDRLAVLTGDGSHQARAHTILRSLPTEFVEHDLFGAPYAIAVREVVERHAPAGLELSAVDWKLGG
jgi:uncharacterized protein YyaL (SSP411 family)